MWKQVAEAEGSKNSCPLEAENIEDDRIQPMVTPQDTLLGMANNTLEAGRYVKTEV